MSASEQSHMCGEVAVAPGWTLLPVARDRLARRLARAGDDVVAIAAAAGPLPSGQSARNHADGLAVRTADATARATEGQAVPALVHREHLQVDAGPDGVVVPEGTVVIDAGAHAHRPGPVVAELSDAVVDCRPVFPWRPVVLVLGTAPDPDGWAEAIELVDALQDLDVDARLAVPSPPASASRWVQPALASETTLRRLRPDAVVAWDPGAVTAAEAWSPGLRSLVVIERTGDGADVNPVSWRIGVAQGRLRGRFGRRADPAHLAALVRRLAAGPQPEAPDPAVVIGRPNRAWDRVDTAIGVHREPPRRSCVYVVGQVSPTARRTADSFAEHLRRANVEVELVSPDDLPPNAAGADIVVLQGVGEHPSAQALAARRTGRPTVVQLDECDLDADGRLTAAGRELIGRAGSAAAATAEGLRILRDASVERRVRTIRLPSLMTSRRYRELARAHAERHATSSVVIGWVPGDAAEPSAWDQAAEEALRSVLEGRPSARLDLVRGGDRLAGHPGVRRLQHELQPHSGARWAVLVASGLPGAPLHREPALLGEAGTLGVPSIVGAAGWAAVPGRIWVTDPDDAGAWLAAISGILDDPSARERLVFEATAAAESLHRPAAADAVVHRFLGWVEGARQ